MRKEKKKSKGSKILFWLPRILTILFIVFISMFAWDVFMEGYSFWQPALHFLLGFFLSGMVFKKEKNKSR